MYIQVEVAELCSLYLSAEVILWWGRAAAKQKKTADRQISISLGHTQYLSLENIITLPTTHSFNCFLCAQKGPYQALQIMLLLSSTSRQSRILTALPDPPQYLDWIIKTRKQANTKSNIISAWKKTGLVPFDSNSILEMLPKMKKYTPKD